MGLLLIVVSSLALGIGLYRLFSPPVKPEGGSITDLVTHQTKETSSFAKLRRDGSLTDKLDLFLAKDLKMEARLENMEFRKQNPSLIIYISSGRSFLAEERARADLAGITEIVPKPLDIPSLCAKLKKIK